MENNKLVVDKMIDILAQQYKMVLRKHGNKNAQVNVTGLSERIMSILNEGINSETQGRIQNEINIFFDERISGYDMKTGEIAKRAGLSRKHQELMNDLRGLSGKFNKSCAEAIIKNTVGRNSELREFNNSVKTKKSFLSVRTTIDVTTLAKREAAILELFDKGVLISPKLVNKDNILDYKKALETVKQFPMQFRPDNIYADRILGKTSKGRNTRRILVGDVADKDNSIMQDYDRMVAYYLLMGGDKPIERFSKVEMSMKQYGLKPNIGISIMKYGDSLTSKLEELAQEGRKSSQEWDSFKNQVLHSFIVAENIGNRNVNEQEHQIWEERLIRLGILERKLEKPANQEETLRESVKINGNKSGKPSDSSKQGVLLDRTMLERAQKAYENTGAIPLGYKLGEDGKTVVSIASTLSLTPDKSRDKLSASKDNLSATKKEAEQSIR